MPRIFISLLLICALQQNVQAQEKNTDALAMAIPAASSKSADALAAHIKQHFTSDTARIRAIYVWVAHNISYDLARFHARQKNSNQPPQTVDNVLATRSAVCAGYADLFAALCKGVGIPAVVVGGYTKQEGKVSPIAHAWAAAMLQGEWFFFDPTWGAGYVKDNKFTKWFNNAFYKVPPAKFIADHMPFDPLYQMLLQPYTHREFIEGKPAAQKEIFHFKDSLQHHSQLSVEAQMAAELRRLQAAGIQNDLLLERAQFLKESLQSFASKGAFDEGGKAFAAALELYKEYITHKNKQFGSIQDADLQQMMSRMEQQVQQARTQLLTAEAKTNAQRQAITGNIANIDRFWVHLSKEKDFVARYFSADAAGRKQLFTRR